MDDAFKALEALNVAICEKTGAGKGIDTPLAAIIAYREELFARREEVGAAIALARKEDKTGKHRHYIDGMEHALESVTHPSAR